jgi:mannose-6-phosphate isomerase-like protein (cupin superfamily)
MEFWDRELRTEEGEFVVVPRRVAYRPGAEEAVDVLLFEPASTLDNGNARSKLTTAELNRI